MLYKTMVLKLLQQHPKMYDQLLSSRTLLPRLEQLAGELKDSHQAWKERFWRARPGSDESQIASEAGEIALQELEASLPSESLLDEESPLSLDAAMAYIRGHMPPA
jgi:hypothetical protein